MGKIRRKGQVVRHESLTERFARHQASAWPCVKGLGASRVCGLVAALPVVAGPVWSRHRPGPLPPFQSGPSMAIPASLANQLSLPVIGSPLFIISNPDLVIAQCKAGVVGSFPSLNARPDRTARRVAFPHHRRTRRRPPRRSRREDRALRRQPHRPQVEQPHRGQDLALCVKHKVPIVITSLGARPEVNDAIHSYGGIVLHDIINIVFAHKALEKGADGLIAVCAGAGGHAGVAIAIRPHFRDPRILRRPARALRLHLHRRTDSRGAGHGRRFRLYRHRLHRHRRSPRTR
jgi:hypothetical protein